MNESDKLQKSMEDLEGTVSKLTSPKTNFLRGIYYGLGFFVGGTVIVGLLMYIMSYFDTAPYIGSYVSEILQFVK